MLAIRKGQGVNHCSREGIDLQVTAVLLVGNFVVMSYSCELNELLLV